MRFGCPPSHRFRAVSHPAATVYVLERTPGHYGNVVEFGGRDINGTVRPFIDCDRYLSIDLTDGPGVDLVADCTSWDGAGNWDLVLCLEVLEHSDQRAQLLESAGRALRPGGRLVLTAACDPRTPHSAVDGGPIRDGEFYRNVTETDLDVPWGTIDVTWDRTAGDVRAVAVKQ